MKTFNFISSTLSRDICLSFQFDKCKKAPRLYLIVGKSVPFLSVGLRALVCFPCSLALPSPTWEHIQADDRHPSCPCGGQPGLQRARWPPAVQANPDKINPQLIPGIWAMNAYFCEHEVLWLIVMQHYCSRNGYNQQWLLRENWLVCMEGIQL